MKLAGSGEEDFFLNFVNVYLLFRCWPCPNDMHSQNVNVLMKKVVADAGTKQKRFNTEMRAWY